MEPAVLPRPEAKRLWTYDEMAAALPESNLPTELWDGEIIMSAAPFTPHQRIVFRIGRCLDDHVRAHNLGEVFVSPVDVVLSAHKAVQPDVLYVSNARASIVTKKCVRGAPDLTVEVIAEGNWRRDRMDKKALYEQFGVAEYWVVDPDAQLIEVFALTEGTYRLHARGVGPEQVTSALLPGVAVTYDSLAT